MATPYSEIFSLFLDSINDYKIDRLYLSAVENSADVYMTPFLIKAIPNFDNCQQDLEDRDDTTRTFNITLTTNEKVILSNLMVVEWLTKEVNDIRQMSLHLVDKGFTTYAEANNLREKKELLNSTRETVEKQMIRYGNKYIDFDDWI